MAESEVFSQLAALSEPTRVRMLSLLDREELAVGEVARILQLPQSTVSRHLKVLNTGGWLARRAVGAGSMVSLARDQLDATSAALWRVVAEANADPQQRRADLARMAAVLGERRVDSKTFFGRVASRWDALREELYGQRYARAAALSFLPATWRVGDLGCGTGAMTAELAPMVAEVVAVDHEEAMLNAARDRVAGADNVRFVEADLTSLPLAEGELDAALLVLVLHHVEDVRAALSEAARVVRKGGPVVVVDMLAHSRDDYRHSMGHRHLGFAQQQLEQLAAACDAQLTRFVALPPEPEAKGPPLFAAQLEAS